MNKYTQLLVFMIMSFSLFSQVKNRDQQISEALLSIPESSREGAKVYGYDQNGDFVTLREGTNEMICLANDPSKKGFSVASYHKSLDPFMARGRELKAQGLGFKEIFDMREKEVRDGSLQMPDKCLLTVVTGQYDADGKPEKLYTRYVFYIPFATGETTGLPTSATGPASPWIMDAGTHRAHIMINPPRD
jgi:hypothetical protein